ncbi:RNA-directed DNA polymerase, eukaryota [Tanacetum coccineum]|uniref:RNA-directed DNA polymerase, eukaryota n=1 Tax=Tanacetum coccineum TaxID=301880 RepID=A0ABQ5BJ71_9ASTR
MRVCEMGDFNEVRVKSDRFGTNFNVLGANIFNSFINSTGLEEVHLGGSAFTWCHKSATKMSKLDRFFVSNNLLNIFPHISGITLEESLSITDRFLLRESAHDYGPVPFRFFHHWIHLEGFNDFVTSTWNSAPSVDSNGMRNLAGTEVEAEKRMEVLAALRNIDHIHSMDLAQKAKIKWSIEGDVTSNFFTELWNKKRNHMTSGIRLMAFGEWSDGNISTLIHVLKCFFHASGLKINLNKSKIMGINVESAQVIQAAAKLGCLVLSVLSTILGD